MTSAPLLSAVLIVRDEESMLEGCLESLEGIVDEVVIVDTGSADASIAVARRHKARVLEHPWTEDFSAARNRSLDAATGRWVLYIDADERLVVRSRNELQKLLQTAPQVAFRVPLRPRTGMTAYVEYRLWRNDPRVRFEGPIHERVVPSLQRVARDDGLVIGDTDALTLEHLGYEGDQTRKHLRNLPMLRRMVDAEPDHFFALHHLATVLDALGRRDEAEEILQAAIERVRRQGDVDPAAVLPYTTLVQWYQGDGRPHRDLLAEARNLFPENCLLLWCEGSDLLVERSYGDALERFNQILRLAALPPKEGEPAYEQRMLGELAHDARATCLFRLGRYGEAADAYRAAADSAPQNAAYPLKVQVAVKRASVHESSTNERT